MHQMLITRVKYYLSETAATGALRVIIPAQDVRVTGSAAQSSTKITPMAKSTTSDLSE